MLLNADMWVSALVRRAGLAGGFAYVAKRGDRAHGSVLLKVVNLRTRDAYLLREVTMGDETVWIRPLDSLDEGALDLYTERQLRYDPDLWVVEIEDAHGRHFLTEKVEGAPEGSGETG
ncbi:DUF1491 family protein [Asticcacaulis sp. EMRT-3]|uniref:DUF1491 family protein n=1 Tax=Asticcacaulis sp. EMRT-3 TaxID=3040349 RepID=UPI0024AEDA65|nr:DUF1491 family protein [Asticcacaulis sp. EMRT-3]MDI7775405.1 DUF1491 family protein [Asticcacaulis sp. EMRT-3]